MFDSLRPHESQHTRPSCPSPTPRVHSDLHPLSQWCHSAISSSVAPFFSCPQSLPASKSFPMSQLFAWGGQFPIHHQLPEFTQTHVHWVGDAIQAFHDLNQIPYDYTMEVRNRFKGLDLIDTVPDKLWMEVRDIVQETGIKTIPKKKTCKNDCLRRPYK